jgi:hypothetical protein
LYIEEPEDDAVPPEGFEPPLWAVLCALIITVLVLTI